jgi:energy-coupling factor transport system permease protein
MRSAFAYTPRSRPLQAASPGAAVAYLGALAAVAFAYSSPPVLLAVGAAATLAGALAGAGRAVRAALRLAVPVALAIVVVNALVVNRGETVLARLGDWPLLGQVDVTAEALAEGAVLGLRALVVMIAFAVYASCVDPDRVLHALRPLAGRSALTATLVSRLVPVAAADAARLREAARLRGPGAAAVGRAPLARRLLAGSLDRAVDAAATLELRGYGLDRASPARGRRRRSRFDGRFYAVAATAALAAVAGALLGAGGFHAYPTIHLGVDGATLGLTVAIALCGFAPLRSKPKRRPASTPPRPSGSPLRGPGASPAMGGPRV